MAELEPCQLSAAQAAKRLADKTLTSEALVASCLARIAAREPTVHAWVHLDPEHALAEARRCDAEPRRSALHGVPIALKDVIDTGDMPTTHGSAAFKDHRPAADAAAVALLRQAGAIILGKVVTAEFATYHPGPTANPLAPDRTPGGSSSGSAAAVSDFHVPIAFGTQTAGSIVRPAGFCGVLGYKPTLHRYPKAGVLVTSPNLDTLGLFARSVDDLLLIDDVLGPAAGPNGDEATRTIGLCHSPAWAFASRDMQAALADTSTALKALGITVIERELPAPFDRLIEAQTIIHKREVFVALGEVRRKSAAQVSESFRKLIDEGAAIPAEDYDDALAVLHQCRNLAAEVFQGVDMLLTPGAPGVAPLGVEATGNPVFNRLWTAFGVPCLGFTGGYDGSDLPLGLQIVGPPGGDRKFLLQGRSLIAKLGREPSHIFPELR